MGTFRFMCWSYSSLKKSVLELHYQLLSDFDPFESFKLTNNAFCSNSKLLRHKMLSETNLLTVASNFRSEIQSIIIYTQQSVQLKALFGLNSLFG